MALFSLAFAVFLMGAQIIKRSFSEKRAWALASASVAWMAIGGGIFSVILYRLWSGNELSELYLPPHTPITYFLYYIGMKFFAPYGVSLLFAVLFAAAMIFINKKCCGKFFDNGEIAVAAASIFLAGFPGVVIFLPTLIVIYLIVHIFNLARGKKEERIPLLYLWLPVSVSVIIINNFWVTQLDIWKIMKL